MVKISLLFFSVFSLFCYMIPGFVLKKTKLADEGFAKAMSVFTLYVASVALLIHGFVMEFNPKVFRGVMVVFFLSLAVHILLYLIAVQMFKKAPDRVGRVLRFGLVFSNAGYMGIPVISDVFGPEYTIYATVYIVWFNIFAFTLGRLIYTRDKKYVSVKKALINPAVVPICIGLVIYLTGIGGWIQEAMLRTDFLGQTVSALYNVLTVLKNMVAPASMIIIGARLADINFKGILKDKYMYPFVALRLLGLPFLVWGLLRILLGMGVINDTAMAIVLILSSTPAATLTTMLAELYDGDSPYAGKLVALTTILSVLTMPVVALLLRI